MILSFFKNILDNYITNFELKIKITDKEHEILFFNELKY